MIKNLASQSNSGLGFRDRPDLEELRRCYDAGMSPIPAHGILEWTPGVHVCTCGSPTCTKNAGKHPRIKWGWMSKLYAPVRWSQVEEWASRFDQPESPINWAYHFRASGLIGLDLDPRNGRFDQWEELVRKNGGLPLTPKDYIPGRGYHLWFRCPDEALLPTSTHLYLTDEMSVELKWGNNYFFGPPSTHRVGQSYRWEEGLAPWETPFAQLPQWLIDLAHEVHEQTHGRLRDLVGDTSDATPAERRERMTPSGFLPLDVDFLPSGFRNRGLFSLACRFRAWGWDESDIVTALLDVNQRRCSPPAPDDHVIAIGSRVAQRYPAGPGERSRPDWLTPELERVKVKLSRPGTRTVNGDDAPAAAAAEAEVYVGAIRIPADQVDFRPGSGRDRFEDIAKAGAQIAPLIRLEQDSTAASIAEQIAELRFTQFPCSRPYVIFLTKPGVSRLFEKRCEKWECPGCACVHREEWGANVRFRIAMEPPESQLYVIHCTRLEWTKRLARAASRKEANHFKVRLTENEDNPNVEEFLVILNQDLGAERGCRPISREDAVVALTAALDRHGIDSKPIHASPDWQLPKREPRLTGEWERLGMIPRGNAADDLVEEIATGNGCKVTEQPTRDQRQSPVILRVRDLKHPTGWGRGDAEHLYFQYLVGSLIERAPPDEECRQTGPARFEIRRCYAGCEADADG